MITQTIINILSNDTTLNSLLGGKYVFVSNAFRDSLDKQINVSYSLGSTSYITASESSNPVEEGRVIIYILVKDTISNPIETINTIANRVLQLLDLKGPFTDDYTSTIYMLRKVASDDITHYEQIGFYELPIIFEFIIQK